MSDSTHLTDDELVAALDGELPPADLARVGDHLTACWTCRRRRDELGTAMMDFVQARDTVLFPRIPPPAHWPGLTPQLARLDGQPTTARALWSRLQKLVDIRVHAVPRWRVTLDRYAARNVNLVHTVRPHSGPSRAERGKRYRQPAKGLSGYQWQSPWLVGAAIFAIVIVAVQSLYERPLAAAEVLARARPVDTLDGHRQLTIEERDASTGRLLGRRRIDVWQHSDRRVSARRLFDEQGRLVAGEWTRADGTRTVLTRGETSHTELSSAQVPVTSSNAWRFAPGAATFTAVTSTGAPALTPTLSESADSYTISAPIANGTDATIVLTVRKADMYPVAHTFTIGGTIVSTVDTAFDGTKADVMPASVFEPDRELLDVRVAETPVPRPRGSSRPRVLTERSALELEIDALLQLDRAGALMAAQVTTTRSLDEVTIDARTESVARRDELRAALAPLAERAGTRVEVRTFADTEPRRDSDAPTSVKVIEFTGTRAPVHDDLRTFFLTQPTANAADTNAVEDQIQRLTRNVLERSLRARLHARAIVQLTSRISEEEVHTLDEERSNAWWAAVREHARQVERETQALRVDLEPVFYPSTSSNVAVDAAATTMWQGAKRLLDLAAAHDSDLSQAFARSVPAPSEPLPVRSPRFRESLLVAEALAASMRDATPSPR